MIIPFDKLWEQYNRLIKPNGAIVLFSAQPFTTKLISSNIENYKYDWVWNKVLKTGHLNAKIMPMSQHEIISIFGKGKINYYPIMEEGKPLHSEGNKRENNRSEDYGHQTRDYEDKKGNTLKYPSTLSLKFQKVAPSNCIHSTQKPVSLFEYLIKTYTSEGETVLDNCSGSGTTGIACVNIKRNYILIEKDKKYFDISSKRINAHEPQLKLSL